MKIKSAKFLSAILSVIILITSFSISVSASSGSGISYSYRYSGKNIVIVSLITDGDELDLPENLQGRTVVGLLDNGLSKCSNLQTVTVPASYETLGRHCIGYDSYGRKNSNMTICGYKNTEAETYAKNNGFKFISLNGGDDSSEYVPDNSDDYSESGYSSFEKLSKSKIKKLLDNSSKENINSAFTKNASVNPPYSVGILSEPALDNGLNRLNAYRRLAGLPDVSVDDDYSDLCAKGALVNAVNNTMTHFPSQPSGMDRSLYLDGYKGTSSSNIAFYNGYYPTIGPIAYSVDLWMNDSDIYNIETLGHRRWLLNPKMGKTGFGAAVADDGAVHTAAYSFDNSADAEDYNFISWPPSGNCPGDTDFFTKEHAWSVTLNPEKYLTPDSNVKVTLTRASDGKNWIFSKNTQDSSLFFNVETNGYGVNNCIIFRPDRVYNYSGKYTVTINGIKDIYGKNTSVCFAVNFFSVENVTDDEPKPSDPVTPPITTEPITQEPVPVITSTETAPPETTPPTPPTVPDVKPSVTESESDSSNIPVPDSSSIKPAELISVDKNLSVDNVNSLIVLNGTATYAQFLKMIDGNNIVCKNTTGNAISPNSYVGTGYTVNSDSDKIYTLILKMDINADGRITSSDARKALRAALRLESLANEYKTAADADSDGKITSSDARQILRAALKL